MSVSNWTSFQTRKKCSGKGEICVAISSNLPQALEGKHFWVLNRQNLNFCICSVPQAHKYESIQWPWRVSVYLQWGMGIRKWRCINRKQRNKRISGRIRLKKECIFRSAGFSAQGTWTSASAVHHCAFGKKMDIIDREVATAGQNARTDKDVQKRTMQKWERQSRSETRDGVDSTPGVTYR